MIAVIPSLGIFLATFDLLKQFPENALGTVQTNQIAKNYSRDSIKKNFINNIHIYLYLSSIFTI